MEQLHRDITRWEDQEAIKNKRYAYSGKDELTGEYYDQVYPLNDNMCVICAKKYSDREFIKKGRLTQLSGLCRFCGVYYELPSNFLQVSLYVGRETLKRYSRLDQYENTKSNNNIAKRKLDKAIYDKVKRYE